MAQLRIDLRDLSRLPFLTYSQPPKEVGIFSRSSDKIFCDERNLKYYSEPVNVDLDLDQGFPEKLVLWKDDPHMHDLDHILKWIKWNQRNNPSLLSDVAFVARRAHLNKVACTPYDDKGWKLAVTKLNGTWYISNAKQQRNENLSVEEKKNLYRGHRMEQYLAADEPGGEPNTDAVIDLNEGFYTVVKSTLNARARHRLLFSAEVDARMPDPELSPPACYVEIKTNKNSWLHNQKLQKCWVQSYLVGVPKIVFGFHDNGKVNSTKHFRTEDIPSIVAEGYIFGREL
ncbi:decapping and exoribonuclease protein-like [Branchiostoma lanceolatum]|uniref:decapping and exoribonuclease protein-like n=1 Tax=Branchiostoma lanceolatum TaxID=7740 RepID=UPI003455D277